jgi:hypothetical protein
MWCVCVGVRGACGLGWQGVTQDLIQREDDRKAAALERARRVMARAAARLAGDAAALRGLASPGARLLQPDPASPASPGPGSPNAAGARSPLQPGDVDYDDVEARKVSVGLRARVYVRVGVRVHRGVVCVWLEARCLGVVGMCTWWVDVGVRALFVCMATRIERVCE